MLAYYGWLPHFFKWIIWKKGLFEIHIETKSPATAGLNINNSDNTCDGGASKGRGDDNGGHDKNKGLHPI